MQHQVMFGRNNLVLVLDHNEIEEQEEECANRQ